MITDVNNQKSMTVSVIFYLLFLEEENEYIKQYDERKRLQRQQKIYDVNDIDQHVAEAERYAENLDKKVIHQEIQSQQLSKDLKSYLLPNISDPALWIVKCKPTKEQWWAVSIMNKYMALRWRGNPIHILSVTVSDRVEGLLYLEAFKEGHVREAIRGVNWVFQSKVAQVPRNEMHQVYEMDKANKAMIKKGQWVRIKNGLYSGDLAKVLEVSDAKNGAIWKIIPRIPTDEEIEKRKISQLATMRPQKKLFSTNFITSGDVREIIHEVINKRVFKWNKMWFRKGFLIKFFTQKNLEVQTPNPTFQEVNSFRIPKKQQNMSEDETSSDSSTHAGDTEIIDSETTATTIFSKGDIIKVVSGELKNLLGKIESIEDNLIKFRPDIESFESMLEIDYKSIVKYFSPGDSVRVISGHYKGEKGIVTKISGAKVYLFSSILMKEFVVAANSLKLSSEVSEAVDKEGFNQMQSEFRICSIVRVVNGGGVFIVLDVEKDSVKVMDENGDIKYELMKDLQIVKGKQRKPGIDREGNKIIWGDAVRIVDGVNRGHKGRIVHIDGNTLFLHHKDFVNTLGIFVDRWRNALILGHSLITDSGEFRFKAGRFPSSTQGRSDLMSGKMVTVWIGEFKGHKGRAVSESGDWVNVELQTQWRVVRILKTHVQLDCVPGEDGEDIGGQTNMPEESTPVASYRNIGQSEENSAAQGTPPHGSSSPGWEGNNDAGSPEGRNSPGWEKANLWQPGSPDIHEPKGNQSPDSNW